MNFRELDSMYCNAFVIILEKKKGENSSLAGISTGLRIVIKLSLN